MLILIARVEFEWRYSVSNLRILSWECVISLRGMENMLRSSVVYSGKMDRSRILYCL